MTGALSDRVGRKPLIVGGMWLQAASLALLPLTHGVIPWAGAMVLPGLGTALVYPTFLAAISDVARPSWRASAVGVYRLWRDSGYAIGALLAGLLTDRFGLTMASRGHVRCRQSCATSSTQVSVTASWERSNTRSPAAPRQYVRSCVHAAEHGFVEVNTSTP